MAKWTESREVTGALKILMLGGGGSGKSTIERGARAAGVNVVREAARDVIDQHGIKGPAVQPLIYHRQLEYELAYVQPGTNMLDRGLIDLPVYAEYFGISNLPGIDNSIMQAAYHRIGLLVCVPPNKQMYDRVNGNDPSRFETYEIACQLEEITRVVAPKYGVELWDVGWQDRKEDKVANVLDLVGMIKNGN